MLAAAEMTSESRWYGTATVVRAVVASFSEPLRAEQTGLRVTVDGEAVAGRVEPVDARGLRFVFDTDVLPSWNQELVVEADTALAFASGAALREPFVARFVPSERFSGWAPDDLAEPDLCGPGESCASASGGVLVAVGLLAARRRRSRRGGAASAGPSAGGTGR